MSPSDTPTPGGTLVLVCKLCRWRPPNDLEMNLVQAHFDLEPDHNPEDIQLELVAWCHRCDLEMPLDRTETLRSGRLRHHHSCPRCRRSEVITQEAHRG